MTQPAHPLVQWLGRSHHPWIQKLISLLWLPEAQDPEVIAEQRQVLLNRTIVISGIGLVVIPFTILTYLAETRPERMSAGIAISIAAEVSLIALIALIRRGAFASLYHLPMFIMLGLI